MKYICSAFIAIIFLLGSGCTIDHHPIGDISFGLRFLCEGTSYYCDDAVIKVQTVDIEIHDITNGIDRLEYSEDVQACVREDITLYNIITGNYRIDINGIGKVNDVNTTYSGTFDVTVIEGFNDYGLLVLE